MVVARNRCILLTFRPLKNYHCFPPPTYWKLLYSSMNVCKTVPRREGGKSGMCCLWWSSRADSPWWCDTCSDLVLLKVKTHRGTTCAFEFVPQCGSCFYLNVCTSMWILCGTDFTELHVLLQENICSVVLAAWRNRSPTSSKASANKVITAINRQGENVSLC